MDYSRLDFMNLIFWTFITGAEGMQEIYRALTHMVIMTKVVLESRYQRRKI